MGNLVLRICTLDMSHLCKLGNHHNHYDLWPEALHFLRNLNIYEAGSWNIFHMWDNHQTVGVSQFDLMHKPHRLDVHRLVLVLYKQTKNNVNYFKCHICQLMHFWALPGKSQQPQLKSYRASYTLVLFYSQQVEFKYWCWVISCAHI